MLLIFLLCYGFEGLASHMRGGEIKVDRIQGSGLRYKITISNYLNAGAVSDSAGELNLGDGVVIDLSNDNFLVSSEPLNENILLEVYEVFHTFPGPGLYLVSFKEFNRNAGILNIPNSAEVQFYTESLVVIDPFLGSNTQSVFSFPPIDIVAPGKAFFYNPGVYDPDGDSLSYELVTPKQSIDENIAGYVLPNDIQFYDGLNYNSANEANNGPPTFVIDAVTGDLTWDAPGSVGEYNFAIKVEEWRKVTGRWISMGFRVLDIQITVRETNNERPGFEVPKDTCVIAGSLLQTSLLTTDPDGHEVIFKTAGEAYSLAGNSATFVTGSGNTAGTGFLDFSWNPSCENARNSPYAFYFKSIDVPPSSAGAGLAVFGTWNVTVAGAPEGLHGQVKKVGEITLSWSDYFCSAAKNLAIYRIENSFTFPRDNCQPGVPEDSGFELIATVNTDDNTLTDNDGGAVLDPNTTYCYRLVAVFDDNIGGESVASAEFCARPDEESLVTGIGDREPSDDLADKVIIYPNPAQEKVNINLDLADFRPLVVGISDLRGRVYEERQFSSQNSHYQISLAGVAPGMYLVWVKTATQLVTRKIVVN